MTTFEQTLYRIYDNHGWDRYAGDDLEWDELTKEEQRAILDTWDEDAAYERNAHGDDRDNGPIHNLNGCFY